MSEGRYEVSIIGFVGDNWIELPDGTFVSAAKCTSLFELRPGSWSQDILRAAILATKVYLTVRGWLIRLVRLLER